MNTMEITKIVGALCGSLLVFLLIQTAAEGLFHVGTDAEVFQVALPEGEGEAAPAGEEAAPVDVEALMAAADPGAGEGVFRRCASCHVIEAGQNRVGPSLHDVVGRDIAAVDGFGYSDALAGIEGAWDYEHLYAFLHNPREYAPGTAMNFAGLSDPEEVANVIAYIEAQSQ
jgi:cytochrome c